MTGRRALVAVVVAAVAVAAVIAVVVAGLGRSGEPVASPTPAPSAVVWPLTGLPAPDAAAVQHPSVAVKVSDVRQAHPQVGVDRADVVFVEPIGVSYSRLAAVFHSQLPAEVGPVRSARPMDAPLLSPTRGVLASTMAAQWVMRYLDRTADVDHLGSLRVPRGTAYEVVHGRPAPDDVLVKPDVLLHLSDRAAPPAPYFSYAAGAASSSAGRAGTPGTAVSVAYGPRYDVTWTWDAGSGRYLRSMPWGPDVTADGTRIAAENVLVLRVDSQVQKLVEGEGAPVPVLDLVDASGSFTALSGGRAVTGTWSKGAVGASFELTTIAGRTLQLTPGRTWVELPTPQADVVVR